ncbi:hypothetical protein [Streptomyces virginiae]|nr:hypothetical protein [Streptomyces virginiae]MCX5174448.1 hypothetical protein [Streptomyces virginiae]
MPVVSGLMPVATYPSPSEGESMGHGVNISQWLITGRRDFAG